MTDTILRLVTFAALYCLAVCAIALTVSLAAGLVAAALADWRTLRRGWRMRARR